MNPSQPSQPMQPPTQPEQPEQNSTPPPPYNGPVGPIDLPPQPSAPNPAGQDPVQITPSGEQSQNKKSRLVKFAAAGLLGLLLIIIVAVVLINSGTSSKTPAASSQTVAVPHSGGGDRERKDELQQLQSYLEAYGYDHHKYPTFANINDPAFRKIVFNSLEDQVFQDPDGTSSVLATTPQTKIYAYTTTPATCDNTQTPCTAYVLTTILSTGQKWKLESFGL